jgi:threonine synthase
MSIQYESTNRRAKPVLFRQAIIQGQAPDKGLYYPTSIPKISLEEIESYRALDYHEIAFNVAWKFLEGEIPEKKLKEITKDAYNFDVPLEKVKDKFYLMRLDRGPTAAFKDFAARFMARIMQYYVNEDKHELLILTATSGDTGSAVANAFYGMDNIRVVVLFPEKEVTDRQRKQMTTLGGNITIVAVDGKFDDCQYLVKKAFADPDLAGLNLSSANSINFGRLLPQSIYYIFAYAKLYERLGEEVVFSVPSGNFGDLMGGVIARQMGLPVKQFVVATNENDEFPNFMKKEVYEPIAPSRACISNAMNVGHPSNLARLICVYGGWMDEAGVLHESPDMDAMRGDLWAVSVSDGQTRSAIDSAWREFEILLEPHGAVGWYAMQRYMKEVDDGVLSIVLETADPAKFPQEIEGVLGIDPPLPESLTGLDDKKEYFEKLGNNYSELKTFLKNM